MLELARLFKIKKLLYVSSGAVYGEVKDRPCELTHPLNPGDLYGASKAASELIGKQYENHFGLDFRIVPGTGPPDAHGIVHRAPLYHIDSVHGQDLLQAIHGRLFFDHQGHNDVLQGLDVLSLLST